MSIPKRRSRGVAWLERRGSKLQFCTKRAQANLKTYCTDKRRLAHNSVANNEMRDVAELTDEQFEDLLNQVYVGETDYAGRSEARPETGDQS